MAESTKSMLSTDLVTDVIDNGQVIESGSHTSLMENNGPYAQLYLLETPHPVDNN